MTLTQEDRLEILQDVARTWLDLLKAVRQLNDAQIQAPGTVGDWSVKDVMGHISFWEQHLIDIIEAVDAGNEPERYEEFETVNHDAVAEMADMSLEEIREQFMTTHDELMQLLERTPSLSRELVAGNTYDHYSEHSAAIRAAKR